MKYSQQNVKYNVVDYRIIYRTQSMTCNPTQRLHSKLPKKMSESDIHSRMAKEYTVWRIVIKK